jgi:hypothetical protein
MASSFSCVYEFAALTCCLLTGKKEKATLSELEKTFSEKIANAEESLKKMKQVNVTTCMIFTLLISSPCIVTVTKLCMVY